ncbi:hypothetical protein [Actinoplanes sp. URMC 104]|uniref:hypothetical protein n=1 Tax=Actinoplanes sp. URMC 104 TaxID=3423409 RepID=UPI003F1C3000
MGFFGTYLFDGERWNGCERDDLPSASEPWLLVDIHDSDFTEVVYRPAGPGSGAAYLGFTPRVYFENQNASDPTDVAREAKGLASWWARFRSDGDVARIVAKEAELRTYLAGDKEPTEDGLDDADVFVEVKTARFVGALGLPPIEDLPR